MGRSVSKIDGWTVGWVDGHTHERDGCIRLVDGFVNKWLNGKYGGVIDGQTDV